MVAFYDIRTFKANSDVDLINLACLSKSATYFSGQIWSIDKNLCLRWTAVSYLEENRSRDFSWGSWSKAQGCHCGQAAVDGWLGLIDCQTWKGLTGVGRPNRHAEHCRRLLLLGKKAYLLRETTKMLRQKKEAKSAWKILHLWLNPWGRQRKRWSAILYRLHIAGTTLTQCKDRPFKPTVHYIPICFTDEPQGGLIRRKAEKKWRWCSHIDVVMLKPRTDLGSSIILGLILKEVCLKKGVWAWLFTRWHCKDEANPSETTIHCCYF